MSQIESFAWSMVRCDFALLMIIWSSYLLDRRSRLHGLEHLTNHSMRLPIRLFAVFRAIFRTMTNPTTASFCLLPTTHIFPTPITDFGQGPLTQHSGSRMPQGMSIQLEVARGGVSVRTLTEQAVGVSQAHVSFGHIILAAGDTSLKSVIVGFRPFGQIVHPFFVH